MNAAWVPPHAKIARAHLARASKRASREQSQDQRDLLGICRDRDRHINRTVTCEIRTGQERRTSARKPRKHEKHEKHENDRIFRDFLISWSNVVSFACLLLHEIGRRLRALAV